jgi:transposase
MPRCKTSKKTQLVTRIASVGGGLSLNMGKATELDLIAKRLGVLRTDLWNEFGSLSAWGVSEYSIDKMLRPNKEKYGLPAKLWEATLYDIITDIHLVQASCIEKVLRKLNLTYQTNKKKKSPVQLTLESRDWIGDSLLCRLVRKFWYRGHTQVNNQIVLKAYDCQKDSKGIVWLRFGGLNKGNPIKIPTTLPDIITGQIRLIKKEDKWYIHYSQQIEIPEKRNVGNVIGVDRGYTEIYATSTNDNARFIGKDFGKLQTLESDYRKEKGVKRNKLRAVAEKAKKKGNISKYNRIKNNNLGRQKWERREKKFKGRIKTLVFTATHELLHDNIKEVAYEDLTEQFTAKKKRSRRTKRNLSAWCKGIVFCALKQVSVRVGCTVTSVNPCYTSQLDSRFQVLLGERKGERFIGFDGVVLQSDTNAADNVLARLSDTEITRYTKHTVAKSILLERTRKFQELYFQVTQETWDKVFEAYSGSDTPKSPERPPRNKRRGVNRTANHEQLTLFNYG